MNKVIELLQLVQDFTDRLTVKRILLALFVGVLATFITLVFENRDVIFHSIYTHVNNMETPRGWVISESSKQQLRGLIKDGSIINMVMVTEIDLQKNRRTAKYWELVSELEPQVRKQAEALLPQPVFDYDANNTRQMVGVLNNEFVCSRFEETILNRHFPYMAKEVPVICRIAIPPFYGRFVGTLTVGLQAPPSKEELDAIRIEAARLAVEIYIRDVSKAGENLN